MPDTPAEQARKDPVKLQVLDKMNTLITAAFGFVAALAWNSAIQEIVTAYLPSDSRIRGLLLYAIIVTVIAVLMAVWIGSLYGKVKARIERRMAPPTPPTTPVA